MTTINIYLTAKLKQNSIKIVLFQGGGELEAYRQLENMDLIPNAENFEVT